MGIVSSRQRRLLVDRGNSKGTAADIQIGYCQADPITTQGNGQFKTRILLLVLLRLSVESMLNEGHSAIYEMISIY